MNDIISPAGPGELGRRGASALPDWLAGLGSVSLVPADAAGGIHLIAYGPDQIQERRLTAEDLPRIKEVLGKAPVTWVNVDGPVDAAVLSRLGEIFELHPLALEDVANNHQRAKVEDYGKYLFIVTRMAEPGDYVGTEQLSLFFGSNYVVTFQESPGGDCLDAVRNKLRKGLGTIRKEGADHLTYALVDAVVDGYFPVIEALEKRLEELEERILSRPERMKPREIHEVKRQFLSVRHNLRPLREAVSFLLREGTSLVSRETRIYLRDCSDHVVRMLDQIETDSILCSDLMNVHLTTVNNRMSEVMKVLTIITTLFIPPTFIAGIYGMNFNPDKSPWNMPELNWFWGYPFALALMGVMVVGLLAFLYWKGWLGDLLGRKRN